MKKHYWLVIVKNSSVSQSFYIDTTIKFINKNILKECEGGLMGSMVVSVSYLGEMTQEEWEE